MSKNLPAFLTQPATFSLAWPVRTPEAKSSADREGAQRSENELPQKKLFGSK